jgi:hypothetical protein
MEENPFVWRALLVTEVDVPADVCVLSAAVAGETVRTVGRMDGIGRLVATADARPGHGR